MKLDEAKILIGDDSILARKQLKDIIAQYGGTTFVEAANGQEAIDKFKSDKPDIVFLDIVMPVKDGIAAVKEIRESDPKEVTYYESKLEFSSRCCGSTGRCLCSYEWHMDEKYRKDKQPFGNAGGIKEM